MEKPFFKRMMHIGFAKGFIVDRDDEKQRGVKGGVVKVVVFLFFFLKIKH